MASTIMIGGYSFTADQAYAMRRTARKIDSDEEDLSQWEKKNMASIAKHCEGSFDCIDTAFWAFPLIKEFPFGKEIIKQGINRDITIPDIIESRSFKVRFSMDIETTNGVQLLPKLRELDLSGTKVYDLDNLEKLKHLERLDLSRTRVSNTTVLIALQNIPSLRWLNLTGVNISLSDVLKFKKDFPKCKIRF